MSAPLDQLLLNWINWAVPDGGDLPSIDSVRGSIKLEKLYERLFPSEIRPNPDDPIEYAYTASACYIKHFNHGPDRFAPPQFSSDENRNMKMLLMNLFLLFEVIEGDFVRFDGEEPLWYTSLVSKFRVWDQAQSTTTEFPLTNFIANYKSQAEQKREEIENIKHNLSELENDIHSKIERTKETYMTFISQQTEELSEAESLKQKLLKEKQSHMSQNGDLIKKKQEFDETKSQVDQLTKETQQLNEELEKLKEEEKEIQQIMIDISGMEKVDLKNKMSVEMTNKEKLEAEKKNLEDSLQKEIDYSERDQLLSELDVLLKKLEETNPDTIIKGWNEKLEKELQSVQHEVEKMQKLLDFANYISPNQ